MADARQRYWHPLGTVLAASALLVAAVPGCGDDPITTSGTTNTTTTAAGGTGGDTGGTGGNTGGTGGNTGGTGGTATGGTGGTGATGPGTLTIETLADAPGALDATPSSNGSFVYFTAIRDGEPGVFKVAGAGGAISDVLVGAPLSAPIGIATDANDTNLFVADSGYDVTPNDPASPLGAIVKLGTSAGGAPTALAGTTGFKPRGLDIVKGAAAELVYFTGVDPVSGSAGLFSTPLAGGAPTTVAKGAPFIDPSGVAVGKFKTFVTDTLASDNRLASLIVIENGAAKVLVANIGIGYPAGVALSLDELTVYVSGINPGSGTDEMLQVDVLTAAVTSLTAGVNLNTDAAGLHRARTADFFSWADSTAGSKSGIIYKMSFK